MQGRKSNGTYCFECQHENLKGVKYCENCGKEIAVCPISQLPFALGDTFAQCPMCGSVFHRHHLEIVLSTSQNCPYCKSALNSILTGIVGANYLNK